MTCPRDDARDLLDKAAHAVAVARCELDDGHSPDWSIVNYQLEDVMRACAAVAILAPPDSQEAASGEDCGVIVAARYGIARSPKWPAEERAFLAVHPTCEVCGRADVKRNVHHVYPFHFVVAVGRPDLELDPRNLRTMCVECDAEHHLLVGHLDSYESYTPELDRVIAMFRLLKDKGAAEIRADLQWQEIVKNRPKSLGQMNMAEQHEMRTMLDRTFPATA